MDHSFSREFRTPMYEYSVSTKTIDEQTKTEDLVNDTFYLKRDLYLENYQKLFKPIHMAFCKLKLQELPNLYESLDASQTWIIYWTLHSLKLLNFSISDYLKDNIIREIKCCQNVNGGFGGGPYQVSHLATSYASVMALVELESDDALSIIDKTALYSWLQSVRTVGGAFAMHVGGELDVRGCYCAITIARLTGILTEELFAGTAEWVAQCQTYEGGFGGAPGLEAHGGYAFCAIASLIMLDKVHLIDLDLLLKWSVNRQMSAEGGFQGRTNKLVDSCYSYWMGAIIPLVQGQLNSPVDGPLYDIGALEEYILVCCQNLLPPVTNPSGGGFIDKPGKHADPYHTCYSLSGLAVAQHYRHQMNPFIDPLQPDLQVVDVLINATKTAVAFCDRYFVK